MDNATFRQLFDSLKVIRKGNEDDFELRASADEKIWGVKAFLEEPEKPTFCLYMGPDAKDLACEMADYELDDEDDGDEDDAE